MEVALTFGGSFLSAILQVAFDRIASSQKLTGFFQGKRKVQLDRLKRTLQTISVVLGDAENKQASSEDVRRWFNSLKYAVHQADDLLDEISTERLRINMEHSEGNLSHTDFSDHFIDELMPRLEEICDTLESFATHIGVLGLKNLDAKQKRQPSSSLQSQILGRDDEKEKIVKMLLSEGAKDISVIPITGMGGVGKTALAQFVYNDERVKDHFKTRAWVCVSEEFDFRRVTKDLLMEVNFSVVDDRDDFNRMQVKLKDSLQEKGEQGQRKCFLVVLDDIWNTSYDDCQRLMIPLNSGSRGSKIIVTTRNENIALMLQSEPFHCVQPIPDDHSWDLFKLHASLDNGGRTSMHEFENIGRAIASKCKGLPLAIKTVAGALRSKTDICDWRDILSSEIWMAVGLVSPALSLSYELLPPHLKPCFAFCALFPKGIPFDKDEVVQLWMANDLVKPPTQKVGRNYFEELRSRSFFETVNGNKYLMHDLINDLARYVSGNCSARIEDYHSTDLPSEVLHLSYLSTHDDTSTRFRGISQVQSLRTFLPVHQSWLSKNDITTLFFSDILPRFRRMRALSLSQYGITLIPDSIGDLKQLRYFNLAKTNIRKLPNSIGKCLNLQTLILENCYYFEELPEDMRRLINLQHLDVRGVGNIDKMASWLSTLKDLQNLSIVVDQIHGSVLDQLNKLHAFQLLKITGLENVFKVENAIKAELKFKDEIDNLSLNWSGNAKSSEDELKIFAKLQPHTNLKQLSIEGYRGTKISDWLGDYAFTNMVYVSLRNCRNCYSLPPLGQLVALKKLQISGMDRVTEVGKTFYGNSSISKPFQALEELRFSKMAEWTTWNTDPNNVEFPCLKDFCIRDCPKLVGDIPFHLTSLRKFEIKGLPSLRCNQEGSLPYNPSCQVTNISNLLSLKKLPQGINQVEIIDCPTLSLSLQSSVIKELVIGHCKDVEFPASTSENSCLEKLTIYFSGDSIEAIPLFSFNKLREVDIYKWESPKLFKFPYKHHQALTALQSLRISDCNNILCFPEGGLPAPSLKEFWILSCKKLKSLPEKMDTLLSSLHYLKIEDCPNVECFPEGGLPSTLETLSIIDFEKLMISQTNWGLRKLPSLKRLSIGGVDDKLFPEEGSLPSTLQRLSIWKCNLEALNPKGFQPLTSLQYLFIGDCPNLKAVDHESLQHLTSLQSLTIEECPNLRYLPEEKLSSSLSEMNIWKCENLESFPEDGLRSSLSRLEIINCPKLKAGMEREKGKDWSKVSHIPLIKVDNEVIS